ncbi:hypothetical protein L6452_05866 [Arctium lappa]|uniref:Uncharacterized protein n=1 Tax=Arctium lappa TaxID=4217 RepID=A0ACB9EIM4_ARCLA|nr:hypothetical protein L6452_05866 [Arctium lappa]
MVGSRTHLGSKSELESESDISEATQQHHIEQPEGGSVAVSERREENPPSEEEHNSVKIEEGTNERLLSQISRATKSTVQGGPVPMDIETEVHTSNPAQANRSEALPSSTSEASTKGETSNLATSSQQDLEKNKSARPLVQERLHISPKDCLLEREWHNLTTQGLLSLDSKVSTHVRFSSSSDIDLEDAKPIRTIIEKSLKKDSPGLMGSPSGANIKPTLKEGPFVLEGSKTHLENTSEVSELRTTLNSESSRMEALEKLVIGNSSILSKVIEEPKAELLKAIPTPFAPSTTSKDFSHFKEEASHQTKTVEDLLKNVLSSERKLKRKNPETVALKRQGRSPDLKTLMANMINLKGHQAFKRGRKLNKERLKRRKIQLLHLKKTEKYKKRNQRGTPSLLKITKKF